MTHRIICENLTVSYNERPVIQNLSFFVNDGEILSILGENGSGKTTLVRCLLGLLRPQSGNLHFCDTDRTEIGYLPQQNLSDRDFPASVWEVVLSGTRQKRNLPFYTKAERAAATEQLERLEISNLKSARFCRLSGGQQQRVFIARALLSAKKVLILDEPVTGLDDNAQDILESTLKTLRQNGLAIIQVTHDAQRAAALSDRILYLSRNNTCDRFVTAAEWRETL